MADQLICQCRRRLSKAFEVEADLCIPLDRAPVTVLFGSADPTHRGTDRASALRLARHIELRENPRAGHFPDLENPEAWLRLLRG